MHAGRYMITCNDALKTDKSSALNLLGESVKSDHYIWEYLIEIQTKRAWTLSDIYIYISILKFGYNACWLKERAL